MTSLNNFFPPSEALISFNNVIESDNFSTANLTPSGTVSLPLDLPPLVFIKSILSNTDALIKFKNVGGGTNIESDSIILGANVSQNLDLFFNSSEDVSITNSLEVINNSSSSTPINITLNYQVIVYFSEGSGGSSDINEFEVKKLIWLHSNV